MGAGEGACEPRALERVCRLLGWPAETPNATVGYVDPALREVDVDGRMPYLLLTTAASGYLRTHERYSRGGGGSAATVVAREGSGGRQELSWPFLLSAGWCGSESSRYAYVSKETCLYSQRGLFVWPKEAYLYGQKWPICMAKRGLFV